ncbi:MAG: biopolymer transporter ExbD [Firmicutes bacterium]|nr:biopolymer transporter ExbD [Bacillota bacterium]
MKYRLDKPQINLNLAPMIDVVFLLLIFFITASSLRVSEVETNINLAETGVEKESRDSAIVIAVTEEGKIYVGEKEMEINELEGFLKLSLEGHNSEVSVYAEREVAFQEVVRVMDIVKKSGVENLSFVLNRKDKD